MKYKSTREIELLKLFCVMEMIILIASIKYKSLLSIAVMYFIAVLCYIFYTDNKYKKKNENKRRNFE